MVAFRWTPRTEPGVLVSWMFRIPRSYFNTTKIIQAVSLEIWRKVPLDRR